MKGSMYQNLNKILQADQKLLRENHITAIYIYIKVFLFWEIVKQNQVWSELHHQQAQWNGGKLLGFGQ